MRRRQLNVTLLFWCRLLFRTWALLEFSFAASCGSLADANDAPSTNRPNVVLIVADDLGWADLGCYGADFHETPRIDELARHGIRFTDAYAASVCSPSRATLLTSKHYARLGITTWRENALKTRRDRKLVPPLAVADLPQTEVTLGDVFHAAGYLTALVGKWHLGDAAHYPETQGFDINIGGTIWGAPDSYFFPYRGRSQFGDFRYIPHLEDGKPGEYLTDRLTDEALKVIDRAGDRPFFLCLAHHAPHIPIQAKPELIDHYQQNLKPGFHHRNANYAAMLQSLDESVGRVIETLNRRGIARRTIVVFVSDNGGYIGKSDRQQVTDNYPLRSGKGSLYEGGVRVPLVISGPGIRAASVCHEPVYVADLFPTLRELAGLNQTKAGKSAVDGVSLTPLLQKPENRLDRDTLFFHFPHYYETTTPVGAIRVGDWKLLEYFEDNHLELYNLHDDLSETKDLAATQPQKTKELRARLADWRTTVHVAIPTVNPDFNTKK